tara:strand:- start:1607 stop:2914 length:1308 start_codon:yes stop_codon:yes gene_type:complete
MATYPFRLLLESVEGRQFSYVSNSFVDTSQDLVLSSSQVYNRITRFSGSGQPWELTTNYSASLGMVSCSYQNDLGGTYTLLHASRSKDRFFKDNTLLSASHTGSQDTGSIIFSAMNTEYDRLLRYKFFGEKVCSVLGLAHNQWIYVDQVRLPAGDERNVFKGNIDGDNVYVSDTLAFSNDADVTSDIPFHIDSVNGNTDRHIKFIDEAGLSDTSLVIGYDADSNMYEISASTNKIFRISGVQRIECQQGYIHSSQSVVDQVVNIDGKLPGIWPSIYGDLDTSQRAITLADQDPTFRIVGVTGARTPKIDLCRYSYEFSGAENYTDYRHIVVTGHYYFKNRRSGYFGGHAYNVWSINADNNSMLIGSGSGGPGTGDRADSNLPTSSLQVLGDITSSSTSTGSFAHIMLNYDKLPSSDPSVKGTVWRDGTDLKISAG